MNASVVQHERNINATSCATAGRNHAGRQAGRQAGGNTTRHTRRGATPVLAHRAGGNVCLICERVSHLPCVYERVSHLPCTCERVSHLPCTCERVSHLPCVYTGHVCLKCMPYVTCMPDVYALNVCSVCVPYMGYWHGAGPVASRTVAHRAANS
jgi:hypothetical protein